MSNSISFGPHQRQLLYQHLGEIDNAGRANSERKVTSEELEFNFATNYLGPFLLTELLVDVLRASAPARIVNVSSSAHTQGKIDFADLQGTQRYSVVKAYGQSKLAQIYFTYELADRLRGTGVTANVLHPGMVISNFNSGTRGIIHFIGEVCYFFGGIDVEKGAQTTLYVATAPELVRVSGKYFSQSKQGKETPSSKLSYDVAIRRRLWEVSEALIDQSERSHVALAKFRAPADRASDGGHEHG